LSLPGLTTITGDLTIEEASELAVLDLPALSRVGGDIDVGEARSLNICTLVNRALDLDAVGGLGGRLRVDGNSPGGWNDSIEYPEPVQHAPDPDAPPPRCVAGDVRVLPPTDDTFAIDIDQLRVLGTVRMSNVPQLQVLDASTLERTRGLELSGIGGNTELLLNGLTDVSTLRLDSLSGSSLGALQSRRVDLDSLRSVREELSIVSVTGLDDTLLGLSEDFVLGADAELRVTDSQLEGCAPVRFFVDLYNERGFDGTVCIWNNAPTLQSGTPINSTPPCYIAPPAPSARNTCQSARSFCDEYVARWVIEGAPIQPCAPPADAGVTDRP
jgi:hypothetical protein